jgi:hypothetical protein
MLTLFFKALRTFGMEKWTVWYLKDILPILKDQIRKVKKILKKEILKFVVIQGKERYEK